MVEVRIHMRLAVEDFGLDLPRSVREKQPLKDEIKPTLNDVDSALEIKMKDRAIPVGPPSGPYEVVLREFVRGDFVPIRYLDDDTFAKLIAAEDEMTRAPDIRLLVLHGVVEYCDFIGHDYELRGSWVYLPAKRPGMSAGFYTRTVVDAVPHS